MALLSNNIETLDINFKKQQNIDVNIEKVKANQSSCYKHWKETIWILNKNEQVTAQNFLINWWIIPNATCNRTAA